MTTKPQSEVIADGIESMLSTLTKGKTRIEACSTINIIDLQGREMKVYYLVENQCPNAQTDISENLYSIEMVTYLGRKVKEKDWEWLYDEINSINPEKI